MAIPKRRCPTCGRPPAPRPENGAWPFCTDRCRLSDLARWIGESYRIPGERAGDGAAAGSSDDEEGAK